MKPPTIAIAPMMDWTDRHYRVLMRCMTQHTVLYTEMVHANAMIHGHIQTNQPLHPSENPVVLQLGGCDPELLSQAAVIGERLGFAEINLNVGCPSPRVQSGSFGACLMKEPSLVASCISAMQLSVSIPVTVKCRIGVDEADHYDDLVRFVETVSGEGCDHFIIHARKAILKGLSPKENRTVPPLLYDRVYQIKKDFPHVSMMINGGIKTIQAIHEHLNYVDGVMLGREAYHNPYLFSEMDQLFYGSQTPVLTREAIVQSYYPYIESQLAQGVRLYAMTRHMLHLYSGQPGARLWRRVLTEEARGNAGIEVLDKALESVLNQPPVV